MKYEIFNAYRDDEKIYTSIYENENYKEILRVNDDDNAVLIVDILKADSEKKKYRKDSMCEHKWIYQTSDYKCDRANYIKKFSRIDTYYCEKCCEVKEKIAKVECKYINDGVPYWWK